jgi:hypothetical protein
VFTGVFKLPPPGIVLALTSRMCVDVAEPVFINMCSVGLVGLVYLMGQVMLDGRRKHKRDHLSKSQTVTSRN